MNTHLCFENKKDQKVWLTQDRSHPSSSETGNYDTIYVNLSPHSSLPPLYDVFPTIPLQQLDNPMALVVPLHAPVPNTDVCSTISKSLLSTTVCLRILHTTLQE